MATTPDTDDPPPNRDVIHMERRPLRDVGNAIGQSIALDALRDLGLVDSDGTLTQDVDAVQTVFDDGRIIIDIPDDAIDP